MMTFNLGFQHANPERFVAAIESETADAVAVQELTSSTAEWMRSRLETRYPYIVVETDMGSTGLFSRYPILSSQWF
jgi:hypothetical protein